MYLYVFNTIAAKPLVANLACRIYITGDRAGLAGDHLYMNLFFLLLKLNIYCISLTHVETNKQKKSK